MKTKSLLFGVIVASLALMQACMPHITPKVVDRTPPATFGSSTDTTNASKINWRKFFTDTHLVALIDTALKRNQELNIVRQEIIIANNEVRARKGRYLPYVSVLAGASVDKQGEYTRLGAVDANTDIRPQQKIPQQLSDYAVGLNLSWQADVWKQLRSARKSALYKYFATVEGRNFLITKLVSEIAYAYYELMALDNQLSILDQNIEIQTNALKIVNLQKVAGMVTELAVRRFQAELAKNNSRRFYIQQAIIETQNEINYLTGNYPKTLERNSTAFSNLTLPIAQSGLPSQLLENRPDIRQAEWMLAAADMNVKVAKANFYPVVNITGGVGYEAFRMKYLITTPESAMFSFAGSLIAPLVNRNEIKATYLSANASQIQAAYNYEQVLLRAFTEVTNLVSKVQNLNQSYELKRQQVEALTRSVDISINLFKSARADYMEVLLTQRDALEAKMEFVETKQEQMNAVINLYQALGGGWR